METKGKLIDCNVDYKSHRKRLTFEVENVSDEELERLFALESLDIKAVRHTEKRSLSSNAYFHVLCSKIADAMTISKARAKNEMIGRYGQRMYAGDDLACIKSNLTIEQVQEMEEPHLRFVKYSEEDDAYFYYIYRGSHTYDTHEMSKLIEGTVAEAKELGIETMPPDELERMLALWKPKNT